MRYQHPVYTHAAVRAQQRRDEIQGAIAPGLPAPTGAGAFTKTACAAPSMWRTHWECAGHDAARIRCHRCRFSACRKCGAAAGRCPRSATGKRIYEGWVRHRRLAPHAHAFRYRLVHAVSGSGRTRPRVRWTLAVVGRQTQPRRIPPQRLSWRSGDAACAAVRERVHEVIGRAPARADPPARRICATSATASIR